MGGDKPQAGKLAIAAHGRWKALVRPRGSEFVQKEGVWRPNSETHPPDRLWFKYDIKAEGPQEDVPLHERKIWIPTENAILVPANEGFEEMYYWDSLLMVKGVLLSPKPEIRALAKGTADNMIDLVEKFGFVPNSNMPPYLTRSQPPVLAIIVDEVLEKHEWRSEPEKRKWLKRAVAALEKEYKFWTRSPRCVGMLSRYVDNLFDNSHVNSVFDAFQENYLVGMDPNDLNWLYATGSEEGESQFAAFLRLMQQDDQFHTRMFDPDKLTTDEKIEIVHRRTACESGWDYSMRSLSDEANKYGRMGDLVAVDLNSMLVVYERKLQKFYELFGEQKKAQAWGKKREQRINEMNSMLFDQKSGFYYDLDLRRQSRGLTEFPSLASFLPLWAEVADERQAAQIMEHLVKFKREYGLATTLEKNSPWQWDGDIGWAPLHHFVVKGLMKYGFKQEAAEIAEAWLKGIGIIFDKHGVFPEKMNVTSPLDTESGLIPQEGRYGTKGSKEGGFGWTNASVIIFEQMLQDPEQLMK